MAYARELVPYWIKNTNQLVHDLDGHIFDFISSWALNGYTFISGFISSYALDRCIFQFWLRFHLVFNFGRTYLVSFESIWTYILSSRISFVHAYFSFLWIGLNVYTNIKDSNGILENPNLCKHSPTGMAHARELVPYWIKNTNQLVHEYHKSENTNVLSKGLLKKTHDSSK